MGKYEVLDHGYIEFIEAWGGGRAGPGAGDGGPWSDDHEVGIVEAARQSTQGSFRGWEPAPCDCDTETGAHRQTCASKQNPGDAKLLQYLYNNHHATPFEFAGMVIEVQAPIFVFREWHRHRTQSYNEMSARYAPLPDKYYVPTMERVMMGGGHLTKQAGAVADADVLTEEQARIFIELTDSHCEEFKELYRIALKAGVPKELARIGMPVGWYSRMRVSTNLRNWLAFLTLRMDPATQWETRQYACAVALVINEVFPHTYELFSRAGLRA